MPVNFVYPETGDNLNWAPTGAPTEPQAIDEGVLTRDNFATYVHNQTPFGSGVFSMYMSENQISPSSMTFRLGYSYTSPFYITYYQLLGYNIKVYNSYNQLMASGAPNRVLLDYDTGDTQSLWFDPNASGLQSLRCDIELYPAQYRRDPTSSTPTYNPDPHPQNVATFFFDAFDIEISGSYSPVTDSIPLFLIGPCQDRGTLHPMNTPSGSTGWVNSLPIDVSDWDLKSFRFSIPNSGNSYPIESGYANATQAAFYGRQTTPGYGLEINDYIVDRVDFWTNYSSGLLSVSGRYPLAFNQQIPYSGFVNNKFVFTNTSWPEVTVCVDSGNQIADFVFNFETQESPIASSRIGLISRESLIYAYGGTGSVSGSPIRGSNAGLKRYRFDLGITNTLANTSVPVSSVVPPYRPRSIVCNPVNDTAYFIDYVSSGDTRDVLRTCDLATSGISTFNGPFSRTVEDIDIDYENNRLYYVDVSGLSYIDLYTPSSTPVFVHPYSGATSLCCWGENIFYMGASGNLRRYNISTDDHIDLNAGYDYFYNKIYFAPVYFTSGINRKVLFSTHRAGLNDLYAIDVDTHNISYVGLGADMASAHGPIELDEYAGKLYVADSGVDVIYRYNFSSTYPYLSSRTTVATTNGVSDFSLRRNKQYVHNANFTMDLERLGSCCFGASSGFMQTTAGYSNFTPSGPAFGLTTAELYTASGVKVWTPTGDRPGIVRQWPDYTTMGYHNYTVIDDGDTYNFWRNAQIKFNLHSMQILEIGEALPPTGLYKLAGLEYVYEDCSIKSNYDSLDLYTSAGVSNKSTDLYLNAIPTASGNVTLYTKAAMPELNAPLFINGFVGYSSGSSPLFLLGRDSGGSQSGYTPMYIRAIGDASGLISLYLECTPDADMNLYVEGTTPDSGNDSMDLFTWSSSQSGVQGGVNLSMTAGLNTYLQLFIDGGDADATSNMNLFVGASYSGELDSATLFIQNAYTAASSMPPLFLEGPDASSITGDMSLFIYNLGSLQGFYTPHHQLLLKTNHDYDLFYDTATNGMNLYMNAMSGVNNNIPMAISGGKITTSGTMDLYSHGF